MPDQNLATRLLIIPVSKARAAWRMQQASTRHWNHAYFRQVSQNTTTQCRRRERSIPQCSTMLPRLISKCQVCIAQTLVKVGARENSGEPDTFVENYIKRPANRKHNYLECSKWLVFSPRTKPYNRTEKMQNSDRFK